MAARVGFLNTAGRRPSDRELAIWFLWAVAIVCGLIWARGLFLAVTGGPAQHVDVPHPASWDDLSSAILRDPFQALALLLGPSRAHRLESWASSSFLLGLIAEAAIFLSLYLRRRGWKRMPRGT